MRKTLRERFDAKWTPEPNSGCWLWTGSSRGGYGQINSGGRGVLLAAHRVSFEFANGQIQKGMCVLHRCDNPPCVNPDHLFLGTPKDNAVDRARKNRGNRPTGEKGPSAVLCVDFVVEIRRRRLERGESMDELATAFGVCRSTIRNVLTGKTWASVKTQDPGPTANPVEVKHSNAAWFAARRNALCAGAPR